ncbi:hypothetical protein IFM89_022508 [Coptis chinensis]|uniref:Uncharacterized protein n=1 Tax=Coptis chinensis TaxID=261450 RepID=A0A835ICY5_9MAGN|nr:hypothetical protein IFM89_022508 [Coptis chinensis]
MARRRKKIVNTLSSSDEQDYYDSFSEDCGCGENGCGCFESTNISELVKVVEVNGETEGESKVKGFHGSLYDRIKGPEFYQPTLGFFYKIKEETPRLTDPSLVDMKTSWSKVFEKFKLDYETVQDRNISVHYRGNWSATPKVVGVWTESDYIGGRNFLLENVSVEYIFFDNFLPSFLQSLPNPYGYTINIVDDPIFLTRGVMVLLANDSDCLMMMREADIDDTGYVNVFITFEAIVRVDEQPGVFCTPPIKREKKSNVVKKRKRTINYEKNDLSEEELDPIPDLAEDVVPTVVVEEFNELNPYNVNIDHIDLEEVYRFEESESEGSKGYEPVYEDFVEQTQELVDETKGELVPTQMEVEEPYVGMEWSTLKSCRTYLRSYAIANRIIKSKKSDGFTTRCNKYEGQHSKFKNRLADTIWVVEKMLDTILADLEKHDKNAVDWLKKRDVTTWDKPVCTFVEELDLMLMTLMRKRRAKAMELDINDIVPREQEEAKAAAVVSEEPESSTAPRKKSQSRKTSQVEGGLNSTSLVEEVQVEPPATM